MIISRVLLFFLISLILTGCERQVLYSNLTESEANEIVARLYLSNLSASKVSEGNDLFRVDTDSRSFAPAVAVLQAHGLPRERFESMGEVFEKDGFVSSPLEERARLNYALSQEISKTISSIDGVILARVHLAVPKREHLARMVEPSSASVFVKHLATIDLSESVGKIKSMVVTGFENLPYENVTVSLFPVELPDMSLLQEGTHIIEASVRPSRMPDAVIMTLVIAGLGLILFGMFSLYRMREAGR